MNRTGYTKFFGKIFFILLVLFVTGNICKCQINAYDGFESQKLSKIWNTSRMVPNSIEFQSEVVRKGKNAAKITLRTNDTFETGKPKSAPTERDELLQTTMYAPYEGSEYEYSFSMFLPANFPIVNTRLVIAQWKQYCQGGEQAPCSDDSPVLAVRYVSGEMYITLQTDSQTIKLCRMNEEIRNKWLDFRFVVRFTRTDGGLIEAYLNDKQIVNYKGITSYSERHGYPPKSRFYFKMGLYRDIMADPMTIYIDEFSMKEVKN